MKDGWFNRILGRIDDGHGTHIDDEVYYQGHLDGEGVVKRKERWFTRWRKISGKNLGEELERRERFDDQKFYQDMLDEVSPDELKNKDFLFDDNWLMDMVLEHPEIALKILMAETLRRNMISQDQVIFKGQLYVLLNGTQHMENLHYGSTHSN